MPPPVQEVLEKARRAARRREQYIEEINQVGNENVERMQQFRLLDRDHDGWVTWDDVWNMLAHNGDFVVLMTMKIL